MSRTIGAKNKIAREHKKDAEISLLKGERATLKEEIKKLKKK